MVYFLLFCLFYVGKILLKIYFYFFGVILKNFKIKTTTIHKKLFSRDMQKRRQIFNLKFSAGCSTTVTKTSRVLILKGSGGSVHKEVAPFRI
jgi:hypothetical protein